MIFAVRLLFQFPFTRVMTANVRSECGYIDSHLKEIIADYSRFNRSAGAQQLEIWSQLSLPARPGSRESVYNQHKWMFVPNQAQVVVKHVHKHGENKDENR